MTSAPANLLAARSLMLDYLDIQPAHTDDDLESAEVGIVGDPAHRGGYHCGSDRVVPKDYSVHESSRDRAGLTIAASALDVGWFEVRSRGAVHNLRTFSVWCVEQCKANTADSRDIREIIYTDNGKTVRRWDRLGKRSTGDSSHLYHTHFSFFRDATKAGRDQRPLFRRYLTEIGMIEMPLTSDDVDAVAEAVLAANAGSRNTPVRWIDRTNQIHATVTALTGQVTALTSVVEALGETIRSGGGSVDTAAILAGVDERLAVLAADTRDAVADLGEGGAAQVRA